MDIKSTAETTDPSCEGCNFIKEYDGVWYCDKYGIPSTFSVEGPKPRSFDQFCKEV